MRYEHYKRVVRQDRRNRFPERGHGVDRPGVEKVTRIWGRKSKGYAVGRVGGVCSGRRRRTGERPKRVYTKKAVAERRLQKGEVVGCIVTVSDKGAYERREKRMVRGRPRRTTFQGKGLGEQGNGTVDKRGKVSFHLEQPGQRPARSQHYEEFYKVVEGGKKAGMASKGAGSEGGATGRYRSRQTGAKTRPVGRARREGRRRPVRPVRK
jgi:ribosomal protein L5